MANKKMHKLFIASLIVVLPLWHSTITAQHVPQPCSFNPMCSCKMARSPLFSNRTQIRLDEILSDPMQQSDGDEFEDESSISPDDIKDISCVGVPFAFLPVLPKGTISHVDIVSSGLEVVDVISPPSDKNATPTHQTRIESLRLMSNKIIHVGDHVFSSMADSLHSLDLSFNEMDEIPVKALKHLQVLDWANFHSNRLASLEGLGHLWSHLSPTLHALFLGNNDLTTLQRSTFGGGRWEDSGHHSLSLLRQLNWLNLDGNQLTDIAADSLPMRLHTLSAAHNRINNFPTKSVEHLRDLRWLDLRGNFIQHLPVSSIIRTDKLVAKLDKLDLGENLISTLPEGGALFNRSLQVRDLYLDFNRIVRLPDSAFRGTGVARLYLAANGLVNIDDRAFSSLSSTLILLDLDRNSLRKYPTALNHLKRLRFLYLANNQLNYLHQDDLASFGTHLEALSLAGNSFEEFPTLALRNCPKLVHLNLAYNSIRSNITGDTFQDWGGSLEVLILKGNQLSQLPARMFRYTRKLRELSLSFNGLSSIHEEALIDVAESLESLEMNMIEGGNIPAGLFKSLHQLQWLSLEYNRLTSLPTSAVDHLHQLRYLSLEGNRFTALPTNLFKSGRLRQLRDIRVGYNQIELLAPRTFHNLYEVTTIVLANNRIHSVHMGAFDHLPKLVTLNLADNRIENLEVHAFRLLPSLIKLDLQSNRLRHFSWSALANCTNALMGASLNVSDNLITNLEHGGGHGAPLHFKAIDISHNLLVSFPDSAFFGVLERNSLKKLLLHHNRIVNLLDRSLSTSCHGLQVLDLHHNLIEEVNRGAFSGAVNLQQIDLSYNNLEYLPGGLFFNLTRLRIVQLSNNHIRSLPKDVFDRTSIDSLNLAHNQLISLPVSCLSSIASTLVNLDLSFNQIDHLDSVMLSRLTNLVSLNLAHNKLSLLPDNVFSHLSSLRVLDLSHNQLRANFKELFHELTHVKELQLSNIGLTRWPHFPLPHLVILNLSSNALDYRDIDHGLGSSVIRLDRLRILDLSRNRFTAVPALLWPSTPLLKQLDISSNPIRSINRESFVNLPRLQTLFMQPLPVLGAIDGDSINSLFFLHHLKMQLWPGPHLSQLLGSLKGLRKLNVELRGPVLSTQLNHIASSEAAPKLKDIEISGAQLKTIQPDVFSNVGLQSSPECTISIKHTSVKQLPERFLNGLEGCVTLSLDVRNNALQTIRPHSIRNNNSLSVTSTRHVAGGLWLDSNQWICSCETAWLGSWLKRWYLETTTVRHPVSTLPLSAVTCKDLHSAKKRHIVDLPVHDSTCASAMSSSSGVESPRHTPALSLLLVSCSAISALFAALPTALTR